MKVWRNNRDSSHVFLGLLLQKCPMHYLTVLAERNSFAALLLAFERDKY